jgi:hypothetical protein
MGFSPNSWIDDVVYPAATAGLTPSAKEKADKYGVYLAHNTRASFIAMESAGGLENVKLAMPAARSAET